MSTVRNYSIWAANVRGQPSALRAGSALGRLRSGLPQNARAVPETQTRPLALNLFRNRLKLKAGSNTLGSNRGKASLSPHLNVIAEEVSRVAERCIGQDMGTMGAATAFLEMDAGSVN